MWKWWPFRARERKEDRPVDRSEVMCLAVDCRNSQICRGEFLCNLKRVMIDKSGRCMDYAPMEAREERK